MEYRIIKETGIITKRVRYFIEKKKKFLLWSWWSPVRYFDSTTQSIIYHTFFWEAEYRKERLMDENTREIM